MTRQSSIQLHDGDFTSLDAFVRVNPVLFRREIILDFATMETGDADISLKHYSVGKYPVTNVQFARFVRETGYTPADLEAYSHDVFLTHWARKGSPPAELLLHPVTFVSYEDAQAYTAWVGGRLPTYLEWLCAACTARRYPWGDVLFPDRCNVRESGRGGTTPVGLYSPHGNSVWGCADTIGNVWEWTATPFDENEELFIAMGTGWDHSGAQMEIAFDCRYRNHSVGFRVVRDLAPSPRSAG